MFLRESFLRRREFVSILRSEFFLGFVGNVVGKHGVLSGATSRLKRALVLPIFFWIHRNVMSLAVYCLGFVSGKIFLLWCNLFSEAFCTLQTFKFKNVLIFSLILRDHIVYGLKTIHFKRKTDLISSTSPQVCGFPSLVLVLFIFK